MLVYLLGAAAASLSAAGYQSMAPTGRWYGETFTGLRRGSRQIALTFDDGPNDPHTLRLVEIFAKHDVHATFFFIGRYVQQRPDIVREVARAGHAIGNHTFTHPNLIFSSSVQVETQIQECERALEDAIGEHSNLFRPPFGGRRPSSLRIARSLGLQTVMWNVTGWDWKLGTADYIEKKVVGQIRGGDVILLHDGAHTGMGADRSQTVIVADRLVTRYKDQGYEFVSVPEMREKLGRPTTQSPR